MMLAQRAAGQTPALCAFYAQVSPLWLLSFFAQFPLFFVLFLIVLGSISVG